MFIFLFAKAKTFQRVTHFEEIKLVSCSVLMLRMTLKLTLKRSMLSLMTRFSRRHILNAPGSVNSQ